MSNYKDSSPNSGSKKNGGLKNSDAHREGPLAGPKDAPFKDKAVGVEPNEGSPKLAGKGVIGKVI